MGRAADRKPLRTRIREAGGFYQWFNTTLIGLAGPAQVGEGRGTPCHRCGAFKAEHRLVEGELHCPTP
ncbi:hypothetical protein [Microbacterium oryzae]|nr:hypothetical protein [Microbacterium oryzae]